MAVLNIPVLGYYDYGDEIVVEAELDKNIVLLIKGHSKLALLNGHSIRKTAEITQLCFGLDFHGGNHGK